MWIVTFSQRCGWGTRSSGTWLWVTGYLAPDVSRRNFLERPGTNYLVKEFQTSEEGILNQIRSTIIVRKQWDDALELGINNTMFFKHRVYVVTYFRDYEVQVRNFLWRQSLQISLQELSKIRGFTRNTSQHCQEIRLCRVLKQQKKTVSDKTFQDKMLKDRSESRRSSESAPTL